MGRRHYGAYVVREVYPANLITPEVSKIICANVEAMRAKCQREATDSLIGGLLAGLMIAGLIAVIWWSASLP